MRNDRWSIAPTLLVLDVVAAATYYRDRLGFAFDRYWGEPPVFCMVYRAGVVIMLNQVQAGTVLRPNHRADPERYALDAFLWVDDADALHAEFAARGVNILGEPHDQPYGIREFLIEDLNGYRIAFGHDLTGR